MSTTYSIFLFHAADGRPVADFGRSGTWTVRTATFENYRGVSAEVARAVFNAGVEPGSYRAIVTGPDHAALMRVSVAESYDVVASFERERSPSAIPIGQHRLEVALQNAQDATREAILERDAARREAISFRERYEAEYERCSRAESALGAVRTRADIALRAAR